MVAPAVTCTRRQIPDSSFPPKSMNETFHPFEIIEDNKQIQRDTKLLGEDKVYFTRLLSSHSISQMRILNCFHHIPQKQNA